LSRKIINCLTEEGLTYKKYAEQLQVSESVIKASVKQEGYECILIEIKQRKYQKKEVPVIDCNLNIEKDLRRLSTDLRILKILV
jgi:transposase